MYSVTLPYHKLRSTLGTFRLQGEEEGAEEEKAVSVESRIGAGQGGLRATPPPAPRRTSTTSISREDTLTPGSTGTAPAGLVTGRSIGNVDTSSKGAAASSPFKKSPKPIAGATVPTAFAKDEGGLAPPRQKATSAR